MKDRQIIMRGTGRENAPVAKLRPIPCARQQGAVAIIVAVALLVMLGIIGLALDTARLYNRKVEVQNIANGAALAAAAQLDGTAGGIGAASSAAASTVSRARYDYNSQGVAWNDAALRFSSTPPPDASWMDSGAAAASPSTIFYVKVDTSQLEPEIGTLQTAFMQVLGSNSSTVSLSHTAVAGRTAINVTPLAICAMSPVAAAKRNLGGPAPNEELIEFGFRRGVSYDLMQLSPSGSTGEAFVIDPISQPGTQGKTLNTSPGMVSPFVCAGTMWMPHLAGKITIERPFPLGSLYMSLNSRFGQYDGTCKPGGAPPDFNIKAYTYNGGAGWMTSAISEQAASSLNSEGKRWTIADPVPTPAGNTAASYGPLWAYGRAAQYADTQPTNGYATFPLGSLSTLYKSGITISNYPSSTAAPTPYLTSSGAYFTAPSAPDKLLATRQRRVLNVPLLACPVSEGSPGSATVLGIGKFFMTVPATSQSIHGEFAGALSTASNGGQVELL